MAGKQQLKAIKVPKAKEGESPWVKVCTGAHYIQFPKDFDVSWALADTETALVGLTEDDCFRFRAELDDNYVNDGFDTLWVLRHPHQAYSISIAKFGTP